MVNHRRLRLLLPLSLLTAPAVTIAAPARAENAKSEPGYSYEMETEFVDGSDLEGDGPRITVRGSYARVLLIRPRTSFVKALLESTETL